MYVFSFERQKNFIIFLNLPTLRTPPFLNRHLSEKNDLGRQLFTIFNGIEFYSLSPGCVFRCCLSKAKGTLWKKMPWDHLGWNVTHGVYIWHNNARQQKTTFQSAIITSTYSLHQKLAD